MDSATDLALTEKYRVTIQSDGRVEWFPGFRLKTTCNFALRYFPFDVQSCNVSFIYGNYDTQNLQYILQGVVLEMYTKNEQWTLKNTNHSINLIGIENGVMRQSPKLDLVLTFSRRPMYYVMNVLVPCFMISLLSTLVFLLPVESGEKISLGITVSLSYTVLLLMVSGITPQGVTTIPLIGK